MHAVKFLSAVLLTTLTTTASAAAAGRPSSSPPQLFERERVSVDKATHPQGSRWLVPDAVEEFVIQADPALLAANPAVLTIDLPDFPALEAVRTRFVEYRPDWKSWIGTLRIAGTKDEGSGYIHLGYHGNQITAMIDYEGKRFRILDGRLVRLSEDIGPPPCAVESSKDPSKILRFDTEALQQKEDGLALATAALGTYRLDILAVYPRAFFDLTASTESALFTFIQDSISMANDSFVNSQIDAYYNLVGIVPIVGASQPTSGLSSGLNWLSSEPAEVVALRNAFGADIVTLYIPYEWTGTNACGIANLPEAGGGFQPGPGAFGQKAYSANRYNCGLGDHTLGHEIGHNYGMRHHDDVTGSNDLFQNGRGKLLSVSSTTKATVMGCYCPSGCAANSTAVCNRIPYFSDPNISYFGVPTGDIDRNNAAVGRTQVPTYSGFKSQSANTPPTANFTVSCSGRTCTFNASSSTDNAAIPSTGYWWDFGDGTTGTGQSVNRSYGNGTTFRVHLVVTDSGGQTDVAWSTANPQPVYEGYVEQANCRAISGWAWDQYQPNTAINVNIRRDGTSVSTVAANGFRQDLVNAGKGNGYHAFGYTPNSGWKDGSWHTPDVRFGTSTTSLTFLMSPKTIICNASIFTNTSAPTENGYTGGQVYTVSTRFSSNRAGYITQLGFHRATGETGSNTLRLWTNAGVQLASVTTNCSSAGWCWGTLSTPVAINANTDYRVGVNTNTYQSKTGCGLPITRDPLTAHQGYWMAGNGFPTSSGACNSNFYVDVKFDI